MPPADELARIRAKIAKLLALAASPEPHEAKTARRRAEELAARFGIDLGALADPDAAAEDVGEASRVHTPFGDVVWSAPVLGRSSRVWRKMLLCELASIHGATVVIVGGRDRRVVGPPSAVGATVYLYRLFADAIAEVGRRQGRGAGREFVAGLHHGLVRGVTEAHRRARRRYLAELRRRARRCYFPELRRRPRRGAHEAADELARIDPDPRALAHVARQRFGAPPRSIRVRVPKDVSAYAAGVAAGRRSARSVPVAAEGGELDVPSAPRLPPGPDR